MRLHLIDGIAYEDMSFVYDAKLFNGFVIPDYFNNTQCTSDNCRIFNSAGGGVKPPDFSNYGNPNSSDTIPESNLGAGFAVFYVGKWPGAGADNNDIIIRFFWMNPAVCIALNNKLRIADIPGFTGSWVTADNPANWDNSGWEFSTNGSSLYGQDTYASGISGVGIGAYCEITHVIIKR